MATGDAPRKLCLLLALPLLTVSGCASHPKATPGANGAAANASNASESDQAASGQPVDESSPTPSGPWKPAAPVATGPGKFAWAEVELQSACTEPPPSGGNASPVRVITTEIDFEVAYCRNSLVDWSHFRLAVIPYSQILVDITVVPEESVVPGDSQVRVLLQTRPTCEADWGSHLHLLLPAGDAHVVVVRKTGPPAECTDGYGY